MRPSPTTITNELTVKTLRRITGVQRRRILSSTSIFEISAISQNFCGRKIPRAINCASEASATGSALSARTGNTNVSDNGRESGSRRYALRDRHADLVR
jgi:hypothetical protein